MGGNVDGWCGGSFGGNMETTILEKQKLLQAYQLKIAGLSCCKWDSASDREGTGEGFQVAMPFCPWSKRWLHESVLIMKFHQQHMYDLQTVQFLPES